MRIYSDIFSGTEVISDSYPSAEVFGGVAIEVKSRMVAKGEDNVDIGCGNAFGGGEAEEGGENPVEKVIDVVDAFNYGQTSFDKQSFTDYFKGYMKKVLGHLKKEKPDRVEPFQKGAKQLFGWIRENFDELSFYTPSDYDIENIIVLSYYKGEDVAPTFIYVMDGLKYIKV